MATITWDSTVAGFWTDTTIWLGGTVPGSADTAVIATPTSTGENVTVRTGSSIGVGNLIVQGAAANLLFVFGTLDVLGTASLRGGRVVADAGSVLMGTYDLVGGNLLGTAELDAVTLAGTSNVQGSFSVVGGLTLATATADLTGSTLDFAASQTLTGNVITGIATLSTGGTLTIAAGTTLNDAGQTLVLQADTSGVAVFVNDGAILAQSLPLPATLVNNGAITLNGTPTGSNVSFDPVGVFENAGTLLLTGGATLSPLLTSNTSTFANSGLIEIGTGSTLFPTIGINGTAAEFVNTGTIQLDPGGVLEPLMTISGGTIRSNGGTLASPYGPLDNMLIAGAVSVLGRLDGDNLTFSPTAEAGSATITLAPNDPGDGGEISDAGALTFSAGTTLSFAATSDIDTTPQTAFSLFAASMSLGGVIGALPDGTLSLQAGTINTNLHLVPGPVSLTGTILTGAGETLRLTGQSLGTSGAISLVAGATLDLDAAVSIASLGSLAGSGVVVLQSTVDATGQTITLDPASVLANVTLGSTSVLTGGTYVAAGLALALNGTLNDTAWRGGLDLTNATTVAVENGFSVTGTAGGPGLITMVGTDNVLDFLTATTLDNVTISAGSTLGNPASTDMGAVVAGTAGLDFGASFAMTVAGNLPTAGLFSQGAVSNAGTIAFAGAAQGSGNIATVQASSLDNEGAISVANGVVIFDAAAGFPFSAFADIGALNTTEIFSGGLAGLLSRPIVAPPSFAGPTAAAFEGTIGGSGTILVNPGGIADLNDTVAATETVAFGGTNAIVMLSQPASFAGHLTNFGTGDAIDLPLASFHAGTLSLVGGELRIPQSSGSIDLSVGLAAGVSANNLVLAEDEVGGTVVYVACFAEGTRLATPVGQVAVERLRPGDAVLTASGAARPVAWTGYRRLAPRLHPRPHDVQPVRIAAGAFAPGVPERALWLSPDHAVLVEGVLIPVRYLVNGASVAQVDVASVTYWHVELATHDVLLAEGLACESFLDTGNRGAFAGEAATMLHPAFARDVWARDACAPLALAGPVVEAARARLIGRLPALGYAMTYDPALCLFADGLPCAPRRAGDWLRVLLPAGRRRLRLRSRIGVPAHLDPVSDDARRLGVAVTELRLDGAPVALADPRFARGWHGVEPGLRWTDGDARLTLAGARLVEMRVAPELLRYVLPRGDTRLRRSAAQ